MLANGRLPSMGGKDEVATLLLIPVLGWLYGWLSADCPSLIVRNSSGRWILSALGLAPVVMLGTIRFWGHHEHAPGHDQLAFSAEFLKALFFCGPLLLLVFGGAPFRNKYVPFTPEGPTVSAARVPPRRRPADVLIIPIGDVLRPLAWSKIHWLEADDNHVRVHTADGDYFVRRSLRDLLAEAGDDRFARIHKSWAVNRAEVAAAKPLSNGDAEIHLRSGTKLRMSRRFRQFLSGRFP